MTDITTPTPIVTWNFC